MSVPTSSELYEILEVDGEHYVYNKKDNIYKTINIQLVAAENVVEQVCEKAKVYEKKKIWINESTLTLINLVEEFDEQFQSLIKKYVWMKISKILTDKLGTLITWQQCDTKWKGLLKICKDIKEHNSTSGKNRRRWEYFEVMNEILHKKPEIIPVAICSSMTGLKVNNDLSSSNESISDDPKIRDEKYSNNNKRKCSSTSSFSKKLSVTVNAAERRHQEKMQRQVNFLKCFNEYVEILRNNKKENNND